MKIKTLSIITLTVLLTACGEEEAKTVQYYLDHPEERSEKLKECYGHIAELGKTQNCLNAEKANNKAFIGTIDKDYSSSFGSSNFKFNK